MTLLRSESWSKEVGWGQSGIVLDVHDGDKVWITNEIVKEMRLDPADSKEIVPPGRDKFVNEFDYAKVAEALQADWWTYEGVIGAGTP